MFLRQDSIKSRAVFTAVIIFLMHSAGLSLPNAKPRLTPASALPAKIAACLPADVKTTDVVVHQTPRNLTVAEKLKSLKAKCTRGRLIGGDKREIRFFRPECFGYAPPDYQEIRANERRSLAQLKTKYNVVVIECDPRIP